MNNLIKINYRVVVILQDTTKKPITTKKNLTKIKFRNSYLN